MEALALALDVQEDSSQCAKINNTMNQCIFVAVQISGLSVFLPQAWVITWLSQAVTNS